ncbi:hypothetical protein U1Q18_025547, partial [Sarracenia purpurea var. burkii]
ERTTTAMEIPTPSTSASGSTITTTTTSSSTVSSHHPPFQLVEITLISAQDLAPVSKSMRTYAVAWLHPDRKLTTRVDSRGNANPTWNDKFVFRVDDDFLNSDSSAVMVEIYTVSWFRDNLVGTVRVLITNLIPPFARIQNNFGTRFVALQVRRASGSPQGILNMAVSLVDTSMRSMPICTALSNSAIYAYSDPTEKKNKINVDDVQDHGDCDDKEEAKERVNAKIQLWRSRSERTEMNIEEHSFPPKTGSILNGSIVNGSLYNGSMLNDSELCSDVGPSASVVAAAIAKGLYPPAADRQKGAAEGDNHDGESSILEDLTVEEATAKGYRSKGDKWRTELPVGQDQGSDAADSRHSRRHSDGGLFSCFAYGFEFTIVCGANTKSNGKNKNPTGDNNTIKPTKGSPTNQNLSI